MLDTAQADSDVLDDSSFLLLQTILPCFKKNRSTCTPSLKVMYLLIAAMHLFGTMSMSFDAQKVYQKLKAYHLQSTKAKMESSVILLYITSSRLGEGTWNGTTE
jgi:NO-binding membrane sensor protein with MHYT domain